MMKGKILTALSAAFVSSLFLSMTGVAAAYTHDITQGDVILTKEQCPDVCPGHTILGTTGGVGYQAVNNMIYVQSGNHKITLSDVHIDTSNKLNTPAFRIDQGCQVDLTLEGASSLKSAEGWAGIYVPDKAVLNITKESDGGSLSATGGDKGAGIGGCTNDDAGISGAAGTINIYGGTITAKGGKFGAGIGGSSEGGAGSITIDGEKVKVTATGGGSAAGGGAAAGIGGGSQCDIQKNGGTLKINNGDVTAKAGAGSEKNAYDIACATLSSQYGKQVVIHAALNDSKNPMDKSNFNGIAWANDDICYVYGNAIIQDGQFKLEQDKIMVLSKGNTLTLPPSWTPDGTIAATANAVDLDPKPAGGAIINGNLPILEASGKLAGEFEERVSLTKEDIVVKTSIYTGGDLLKKLVPLPDKREVEGISKKIDQTGWTYKIDDDPAIKTIVNAKVYQVELCHPIHQNIVVSVTISKCPMDTTENGAVKHAFNPPTNIYTGEALKPELTLTYNNIQLVPGKDYEIPEYSENINAGTAKVVVKGKEGGNFTGSKTLTFNIVPASIEKAGVALEKDSVTYNGSEQDPGITVSLGEGDQSKQLQPDTEYTVKYLKAGTTTEAVPKDAGKYTVQINGKGNYEASATAEFEIKPIELSVLNATAESAEKVFDGTADIKIINVNLNLEGVIASDQDQVIGPASRQNPIKTTLESSAKGTYTTVNLEPQICVGPRGHNYLMMPKGGKADLSPAVSIVEQKGPDVSDVQITYEESPNYMGEKFRCTLKAEPESESVQYEYSMDSDKAYQISPIFDNITPGSTHTFYVRAKAAENITAGAAKVVEYTFEKLEKQPPEEFTFDYVRNPGEPSFKATIPSIPGAVYFFSTEEDANLSASDFTTNNIKEDCEPSTSYTAYVMYRGDGLYKDSPVTKCTKKSPALKVERPVIQPGGLEDKVFLYEMEVTITCGTEGAKIYYTLDGKSPVTEDGQPSSTAIEYTQPIIIRETTKITAVAVYDGMDASPAAETTYQKAGDKEIGSKVDAQAGTDKFVYTPELTEAGFGTTESERSIEQELSLKLSELGYNSDSIAYYEVTLKMGIKDKDGVVQEGKWIDATVENFPVKSGKGCLKVQMSCPEGTSTDTHDFAVVHMFSQTAERLGVTKEMVGTIEAPKVAEKDGKLEFTLTSTSPVAIGWKQVKNSGGNNDGNKDEDPDGKDPDDNPDGKNDGKDPDGTNPDGTNPDGTNPDGTNPDGTNPDGTNPDGTNPDGTGAGGKDGANGEDTTAADRLKSMLAPITGDSAEIVVWAVLFVIAVGAVIAVIKKKKR